MTIKKTFIWTTVHTVIKILSGIIMNKVIAVYLGPSGLAMLGQFQNFSSIASSVSNGSIQTGLLTQTAKYNKDQEKQKIIWFNGLMLSFFFTVITSVFIFVFAKWLSLKVLFSGEYSSLFSIFSISLIFYSLNLFIISIVNGLGNIKLYTIVNILISLFTLILVSILTIFFKFEGAILGIILTQSIVFVISYAIIYKYYKNSFFIFDVSMLNKSVIKVLLSYGLTSFSSGLIMAVTYMTIRAIIVNETSLEDAGLWEAAIKIGLYFNMLFSIPISIYYLPKFAQTNNITEINKLILQAFTFITPIAILVIISFSLTKEFFIHLLFAQSFMAISLFIVFILIAEVFRIYTTIFSNLLLSKGKLKKVILFEFIFGIVFVNFSYFTYVKYGLQGLSIVYLIVSFFLLFIYFKAVKNAVY